MRPLVTIFVAAALCAGAASAADAQKAPATTYDSQQRADERALQDYKDSLAAYQRDRAAYDRRYGTGAYDRKYDPPPAPVAPSPAAPPARRGPVPVIVQRPYVSPSCERRSRNAEDAVTAGALGPATADTTRTDGPILGAIVGGTLGANLASSPTTAERYAPECDGDGAYYAIDQTLPYRERPSARRVRNGSHDERYYVDQGCRLAVAPVRNHNGTYDFRYARVCPDRRNRLRYAD